MPRVVCAILVRCRVCQRDVRGYQADPPTPEGMLLAGWHNDFPRLGDRCPGSQAPQPIVGPTDDRWMARQRMLARRRRRQSA